MKGTTKEEQQSAATTKPPPPSRNIRIGHSSSSSSSSFRNSSSSSSRPTKVSLLLAHFFSLVLIPLIFPDTDRTVFWKVAQKNWTKLSSYYLVAEPPQKRPRSRRPVPKTPQQEKFYISDPHVHLDDGRRQVFLDYQMAASVVSADVLRVALYDWECQDELVDDDDDRMMDDDDDDDETNTVLSSWNFVVSHHPPERLTTQPPHIDDNDNEDILDFPTSTWRLTLDVVTTPTTTHHYSSSPEKKETQQEHDTLSRQVFQKQLCVRWMLHNLPLTHEYSMEVTFQRTQLQIEYDVVPVMSSSSSTDPTTDPIITIQNVQIEFPEEVGVDVHVDGRGRAVVYDAEL